MYVYVYVRVYVRECWCVNDTFGSARIGQAFADEECLRGVEQLLKRCLQSRRTQVRQPSLKKKCEVGLTECDWRRLYVTGAKRTKQTAEREGVIKKLGRLKLAAVVNRVREAVA